MAASWPHWTGHGYCSNKLYVNDSSEEKISKGMGWRTILYQKRY